MGEVDAETWTSGDELIALAADHGEAITPRSLELWRYRGLLPRPVRRDGGRAVWLYPPGTDRQLLRLLHWRTRVRDLELIRVTLWVEGFPIDLEGVRGALSAAFDAWAAAIARERPAGDGADLTSAVDALARKMAAMRGRAVVQRVVRMKAAERTRAYGYMLALMFGLEEEIERRKDDALLLERMVGLRSGRGGGLATVMPTGIDEQRLVRLPPPSEVKRVIVTASDDEYEFVRRMVQMMVIWTPLLLPLLLSEYGANADGFVTLVRGMFDELRPSFYPLLVGALLVLLHGKDATGEELHQHIRALEPGRLDLEFLLSLPTEVRAGALAGLPADRKELVASHIEALRPRGAVNG